MQEKEAQKTKLAKAACAALALALASCTTTPVGPAPSPSPTVGGAAPAPKTDALVEAAVALSACPRTNWSDRGVAGIGYIRGVAQVFAHAVCADRPVLNKALGTDDKDALVHMGIKQADISNTYTLLLGLGMRESSGKYYEGIDLSASNAKGRAGSEMEAGLFQSSFNSFGASPELKVIWDEYHAHPERCLVDVFKPGYGDHMTSNYGQGQALEFQGFTKTCPAFAVEYNATLLRVLRRHFGPINTQAAQFIPACKQMFSDIQEAINCK